MASRSTMMATGSAFGVTNTSQQRRWRNTA
nr:MAG TPA: hypothetical protein [Caudoviricetes sp.]